jgi:hypothetical protein
MHYALGQLAALEKLGYNLNDASKVLGAAKKRMLPKASNRLLPELAPGSGFLKKELRGPMGAGGLRQQKQRVPLLKEMAKKVPAMADELAAAETVMDPHGPAVAGIKQLTGGYRTPGAIIPGAPDYRKLLAGHAGDPSLLKDKWTPDQYKMLNSVIRGHELDETTANLSSAMAPYGHISPEVMLKEHNRIATLPEGFSPIKELMQKTRARGEAGLMSNYGIDYGNSPRLSRHARKRITQGMERDQYKQMNEQMAAMAEAAKQEVADGGIRFDD